MNRAQLAVLTVLLVFGNFATLVAEEGTLQLPPYQKTTLQNGLTILLMEQQEVPLISFSMIVGVGSVADPAGKEGLASLTASLLRKGTKTRSAREFSEQLDFMGARFRSSANPDYTALTAEFVKKDLTEALEILSDMLLYPVFPQEEVSKLAKQRVDGIKSAKDSAQGVIGTYFNSYLYGDHPYGRPVGGDENSLSTITRDDVVEFFGAHYIPKNTILAIAGAFRTSQMAGFLQTKFESWSGGEKYQYSVPPPAQVQGRRLLLIDQPDSTQTFFQIGNIGIARTNPDRIHINIINTLFGGRFTSMLNSELRVNSGLTYGARSSFTQRKTAGPFVISTYTSNASTQRAIDMTLDLLKRLHQRGFTEKEILSAKNYIKGQFPLSIETSDQLANLIARMEFFGLDASEVSNFTSKVDAMTLEDARRIIQEYFPLDNLVFVLIGKAGEIKVIAEKYVSQINQKAITDLGF